MRLSYDGHGLNRADGEDEASDGMPLRGERLITWQRRHRDQGGDYVVPDEMARELGPLLAAAPELLESLNALLGAIYVDFEAGARYALSPDQKAMRLLIAKARGAVLKATTAP